MYSIRLYERQIQFSRSFLRHPLIAASLLMIGSALNGPQAAAQAEEPVRAPEISGTVFADYAYTASSPGGTNDGDNGFGYRRAYLTFDYSLSERIDARLRFETKDSRTTDDGLPAPFIKDLWLRLKQFPASGHSVVFGLHPTPNFRMSEDVWGYRSLESTVQDRADVVGSRDMGISFMGPIAGNGTVRYRVMAANNSGVREETDKFKRIYGSVEFQPENGFRAAVGADYYQLESVSSTNIYAFIGAETQTSAGGVEIFSNALDRDFGPEPNRSGLSLFGTFTHADDRTFIGRLDLTGVGDERFSAEAGYVVIGYAIGMDDRLEIIPNLEYWFFDGTDDTMLRVRLTLSATL